MQQQSSEILDAPTLPPPRARRRGVLGGSLMALAASVAGTSAARAEASLGLAQNPDADADLIRLSEQLVAIETESWLLGQHDEHAFEFGPNRERQRFLASEYCRLEELLKECSAPTTIGGAAAFARAGLALLDRDSSGAVINHDWRWSIMAALAQFLAPDFVWPPRPGSCSTEHWAPPTSAAEITEYRNARASELKAIRAKIQAERGAEEAERNRASRPATMTDKELLDRKDAIRDMSIIAAKMAAECEAELFRRGLA